MTTVSTLTLAHSRHRAALAVSSEMVGQAAVDDLGAPCMASVRGDVTFTPNRAAEERPKIWHLVGAVAKAERLIEPGDVMLPRPTYSAWCRKQCGPERDELCESAGALLDEQRYETCSGQHAGLIVSLQCIPSRHTLPSFWYPWLHSPGQRLCPSGRRGPLCSGNGSPAPLTRHCHSTAPPSTFSRCINSDGERASAEWQSCQGARLARNSDDERHIPARVQCPRNVIMWQRRVPLSLLCAAVCALLLALASLQECR